MSGSTSPPPSRVYADLNVDQEVEDALAKEGAAELLQPIQCYEQARRLSVNVFTRLGTVAPGLVRFSDDPAGYVRKLIEVDGLMDADVQQLPSGAVPTDYVHALFEAVHTVGQGARGTSSGGGSLQEELRDALQGKAEESTSVKPRDILGLVERARNAGVALPGSEHLRPGPKALSKAKDALQPKQPTDAGLARVPPAWPRLELGKVDSEAGVLMCPAGADSSQCVHAYAAFLYAALTVGHHLAVPATQTAKSTHEGAYTPTGGHKMVDAKSVDLHLEQVRVAQLQGGASGAEMREALEALGAEVREKVVGTGDPYQSRLCPGAALRAAAGSVAAKVVDARKASALRGEEAPAAGDGGAGRGAGGLGKGRAAPLTAEQEAQRSLKAARREEHERNAAKNLALRSMGLSIPRGGAGRGAMRPSAPYMPPCRDFANKGYCAYGSQCRFSHIAPQQGAYGYAPPGYVAPGMWGPRPPPGPPPGQAPALQGPPQTGPHLPALMPPPPGRR